MRKIAISTNDAPKPVGNYSQAISTKNSIFISGQIGLEPKTGKICSSEFESQLNQVFQNLSAICEGSGVVSIDSNDIQTGNAICQTSTNLNFDIIFDGLVYDQSTYQSYQGSYGALEGDVEITLPSGDVYITSYYGDCYAEPYYSYVSMYWDVEILTPNGPKVYSGYFYTY